MSHNPDEGESREGKRESRLDVYTWLPSDGDYQASLLLGNYIFLLFTKDRFAGDDPTPDFLAGVDIRLGDSRKSLPDNDFLRAAGLYETRVLGGWYNTSSKTYGYAQMQVQPTDTAGVFGTLFFFNDDVAHGKRRWMGNCPLE